MVLVLGMKALQTIMHSWCGIKMKFKNPKLNQRNIEKEFDNLVATLQTKAVITASDVSKIVVKELKQ
jgi:hypothetical protein